MEYQAPAQGEASLEFRVRAAPEAARYPTPRLLTTYWFGEEAPKNSEVAKAIVVRPRIPVRYAASPPQVDGDLGEWGGVDRYPLQYAPEGRFDINDRENLSAECAFQWDENNFYLAVWVNDNVFYQPYQGDATWGADSLQIFFDPQNDGNDEAHHRDDYEYLLALTQAGPEACVTLTPDNIYGLSKDIALGLKREGSLTTYEAAFPGSRIAPARLTAGERFGFTFCVNDKDGATEGRRHWWVDFTPGAGAGATPFPLAEMVLQ